MRKLKLILMLVVAVALATVVLQNRALSGLRKQSAETDAKFQGDRRRSALRKIEET